LVAAQYHKYAFFESKFTAQRNAKTSINVLQIQDLSFPAHRAVVSRKDCTSSVWHRFDAISSSDLEWGNIANRL